MTARSESIAIDIDDEQMSGTFLSPKSKVPGVLFVHGWGGSQERDLERAKGIAGLGCVCLTFDLRGHAGTGIPLGDRCTIESGLYITAGTKVEVLDDKGSVVEKVKARDLAGQNDLLFRRNSLTGAVQCVTNKSAIELNEELHKHN
jgi:dienelactone hydrolase